MTRPVSIVIPSLASVPLLERALQALREEFRAPAVEDQVLAVDDTGNGVVCQAFDINRPEVRALVRKQDGGFAASALDGAQAADHRLMLFMHTDVVVRPGALTGLAAAMHDETVYAATLRVLDGGAKLRSSHESALASGAEEQRAAHYGTSLAASISIQVGLRWCRILLHRESRPLRIARREFEWPLHRVTAMRTRPLVRSSS